MITQHLKTLLLDRTTCTNLHWAVDDYSALGEGYGFFDEVSEKTILAVVPRFQKSLATRTKRTKAKSEVFTPSALTKMQTDLIEEELAKQKLLPLSYIDKTAIELAAGEGPYLASRVDRVTGKAIPISERWGILDRKLKVASKLFFEKVLATKAGEAKAEDAFILLAERAFKAVYAFEWSADSLFLARSNLLLTFADFFSDNFGKESDFESTERIAQIISWNVFQMDGTTFKTPATDLYSVTMDWEEDRSVRLLDIFLQNKGNFEKPRA